MSKSIKINAKYRKPLKFLFGFILIIYAGLNVFYYNKFGLRIIGWHTHLFFLIYIWLFGLVVLKGLARLFKFQLSQISKKWNYLIWVLFSVELLIMITGLGKIKAENWLGYYWSPYRSIGETYYHIWSQPHELKSTEFSFHRDINYFGFADKEWHKQKRPGETRILSLGDSFTEGDGADYDSSYVSFLRRSLKSKDSLVTIMNAGTCGSDPYFNFVNLQDRLVDFKPDLVIQTIDYNDVFFDIFVRGGMDRFVKKGYPGKVSFNKPPWWEFIYASSYIARIGFTLAGYDVLLKNYPTEQVLPQIRSELISLFNKYNALAVEHDFKVILVVVPNLDNLGNNHLKFDVSSLLQMADSLSNFYTLNLVEPYKAYMLKGNLTVDDVYWKKDRHHNASGYEMMATCIEDSILPIITNMESDSIISK